MSSQDSSRPALVPELYVSDLDASLAFYVEVVGFEVEYERPDEKFAALSREGAHLMLEQAPSLAASTRAELEAGQWRTAELQHPFGRGVNFEIAVTGVDAIASRIESSGHSLILEPHDRTYRVGGEDRRVRQLLVADPDGYLIRLSELRLGYPPSR